MCIFFNMPFVIYCHITNKTILKNYNSLHFPVCVMQPLDSARSLSSEDGHITLGHRLMFLLIWIPLTSLVVWGSLKTEWPDKMIFIPFHQVVSINPQCHDPDAQLSLQQELTLRFLVSQKPQARFLGHKTLLIQVRFLIKRSSVQLSVKILSKRDLC